MKESLLGWLSVLIFAAIILAAGYYLLGPFIRVMPLIVNQISSAF